MGKTHLRAASGLFCSQLQLSLGEDKEHGVVEQRGPILLLE